MPPSRPFYLPMKCLLLCAFFLGAHLLHAASPPNILILFTDDQRADTIAALGNPIIKTPNIDRLAAQGTKFTNHHHCQNCQPTRAALMTGQYGPRTGVYTVGGIDRFDWQSRPLRPVDNVNALPLDRTILPQALKTAGYATGMFGKWHLDGNQGSTPEDHFDVVKVGGHAWGKKEADHRSNYHLIHLF